jgi:hypothetical protein
MEESGRPGTQGWHLVGLLFGIGIILILSGCAGIGTPSSPGSDSRTSEQGDGLTSHVRLDTHWPRSQRPPHLLGPQGTAF